jgi:undecaprenyl-diphosphatase
MDLIDATLLGLVEGLTEFVPVSSTGHLILAGAWLGLDHTEAQKQAVDAFDIVIQAGAWLACVWYYWPLLMERYSDLRAQTPERVRQGRNLLQGLAIAFVPVMVVGLLARKQIKALFFGPTTVAAALAIGGVAMIAADLWLRAKEKKEAGQPLEALTRRQSVVVGAFQCLALIPGTSRSMSTMIGGLFAGMNRKAAADFSFLLAIPVLGAATAYELLKEWHLLLDEIGLVAIAIGLIAAFLSGLASISVFLKIIGKFGLVPFGIYRIVLAAVVWKSLL